MAHATRPISLLLIDEDVELGERMREYFAPHAFAITVVTHGPTGLEAALGGEHALVILDVMVPGLDGFALLRQLRRRSMVPVIMVAARVTETDRIHGLDAGADDYLAKSFGLGELLARVRAVLRRAGRAALRGDPLVAGPLRLASAERPVWKGDEAIVLTTTEFDILEHLVRAGGRVVARRELMAVLYQSDYAPYDRSVDVHVSHLRKKLGAAGAAILTMRGEGYSFSAHEPERS